MHVENGLSPALALKSACVSKMCNFVILKRLCGLKIKFYCIGNKLNSVALSLK